MYMYMYTVAVTTVNCNHTQKAIYMLAETAVSRKYSFSYLLFSINLMEVFMPGRYTCTCIFGVRVRTCGWKGERATNEAKTQFGGRDRENNAITRYDRTHMRDWELGNSVAHITA